MTFFAMVASLLFFAGFERETGNPDTPVTPPSGNGLFTVSKDGHQIRFALGNLVYDGINGYRFAAHQYDYGGDFGWGTGSNPTLTSTDREDYPTFDDWGNYIAGGWRTLTAREWEFLLFIRAYARDRRGAATVCGVHGMVLLPDNFSGGTFQAGFDHYHDWSSNVYDASSWAAMEAAGAVFLPAAGCRYGTRLGNVGTCGCYWSSTPNIEYMYFFYNNDRDYGVSVGDYFVIRRVGGLSVRLVQDY